MALPQSRAKRKKRKRLEAANQLHKKQNRNLIIAAVIIGVLVMAGIAYVISQNSTPPPSTPPSTPTASTPNFTPPQPVSVDADGTAIMASGLKYKDIVEGAGESPSPGRLVTVQYTGTLTNGKKFDSSLDSGQPYKFIIGKGKVIKGWDEGIMTMKVGGKRKLIIPPDLGYGARGSGERIPPNSTLLFDVELLGVK